VEGVGGGRGGEVQDSSNMHRPPCPVSSFPLLLLSFLPPSLPPSLIPPSFLPSLPYFCFRFHPTSCSQSPNCNFLENMDATQRTAFRRMVIDMVLATDMARHLKHLGELKTLLETKKVANEGILVLDKYKDRLEVSWHEL